MKIKREDFKAMLKEALKDKDLLRETLEEMVSEGAFNQVISEAISGGGQRLNRQQPPQRGRYPQSQFGAGARMVARELASGDPSQAKIFEEVLAGAEETARSQRGGEIIPSDEYDGYYADEDYEYQQQQRGRGRQQQRPNNQHDGGMSQNSKWTELAFGTPLSNRPQNEGGMGGHYLPGISKNHNG